MVVKDVWKEDDTLSTSEVFSIRFSPDTVSLSCVCAVAMQKISLQGKRVSYRVKVQRLFSVVELRRESTVAVAFFPTKTKVEWVGEK